MKLNTHFRVRESGSSIRAEIFAGLTTFASMAYIIIINPLLLSYAKIDEGAAMSATILITSIATMGMALIANLPLAIAPGMGVSTFMVFSIILSGQLSWQETLAAVFLTGALLFLLNIFNLRAKVIETIPRMLMKGAIGGIGLFLIVVGLRELKLIQTHSREIITFHLPDWSTLIISASGLIITLFLLKKEIRTAFIIGILSIWILSLCLGLSTWNGFFSFPPSLSPTFAKFSFQKLFSANFWQATFSIFLITLFDSSAALLTLKSMLKRDTHTFRNQSALWADASGTMLAAILGTGSLAIHLESASGIRVGGRTGMTNFIVAICFLFCLFTYPFIASIPPFASSPVLIMIGGMMLKQLKGIDFKDFTEWVPSLITLISMPLFFSIYIGFVTGFITYSTLKILTGRWKELSILTWTLTFLLAVQCFLSSPYRSTLLTNG